MHDPMSFIFLIKSPILAENFFYCLLTSLSKFLKNSDNSLLIWTWISLFFAQLNLKDILSFGSHLLYTEDLNSQMIRKC